MKIKNNILFLLLVINFCIFNMQFLRRTSITPKRVNRVNSIQKRSSHAPVSPPISFWSRIEQSISQFIEKIRSKYSASSTPLTPYFGQSEITSIPMAAMIETLQQDDINKVLEVMEQNRTKHNLDNDMNGLIRCGYPGPEFLIISEIKSIDQFESFFENMRKRLFLSIGFDEVTSNRLLSLIKEKRAQAIKNFYTTPHPDIDIVHEDIPELDAIKELLVRVNINPETIPIKLIPRWQALKNMSIAAFVQAIPNKERNTIIGNELHLNPILTTLKGIRFKGLFRISLKQLPLQTFIIAHEIGHLLRNHCEEYKLISDEYKKLFPHAAKRSEKDVPDLFNKVEKQLEALYELEADITVALLLPQEVNRLVWEIINQHDQTDPSRRTKHGPIHSSIAYKRNLFVQIFNLYSKSGKFQQVKE